MEFWVILVAFRQWKNGQKWKKTLYIARFFDGFWMPEHWKHCKNKCFGLTLWQKPCKLPYAWLEALQKHGQKQCFGRIYCLYGKKRVNYRLFDWKHWKNTVKNNVLEGFLIYMLELATGIGTWKDWRNTVNSGVFNGWGDKRIGCIVEHDVFDRFYGDKSVKYRALKETIAKTWKRIQRTRDLGDYLGVVV